MGTGTWWEIKQGRMRGENLGVDFVVSFFLLFSGGPGSHCYLAPLEGLGVLGREALSFIFTVRVQGFVQGNSPPLRKGAFEASFRAWPCDMQSGNIRNGENSKHSDSVLLTPPALTPRASPSPIAAGSRTPPEQGQGGSGEDQAAGRPFGGDDGRDRTNEAASRRSGLGPQGGRKRGRRAEQGD